MSEELKGQIRTVLAFVGGIAVTRGWVDNETMFQAVGFLTAVIAAVWSWRSKSKPA